MALSTKSTVTGANNPGYVDTEDNPKKESEFKNVQIIDDDPEEDVGEKCQYLGIPCPAQKRCLTAVGILIFLCWASTIQGMVINGFVNAVISTLEKRFDMTSTMTGVIAGSYDIGSLVTVIPITYFGGSVGSSKPKYISVGLYVMGLGSLLFAMPHFIAGPYLTPEVVQHVNDTDPNLFKPEFCLESNLPHNLTDNASKVVKSLSVYKYFFIFGQILHGIGAAPLITLGTTFLDESVGKVSSPMYIGIFQTFFVVGPALGFLLGGSLLQVYVDLSIDGLDESLNPSHPLWVGAWWIGFLLSAAMAFACAVFIGSYPKKLPTAPGSQVSHGSKTPVSSLGSIRQMPKAIKALVTNPTYMFISLGAAADGLVIAGLSAFLPKFIQSQYKFTASLSSGIVGLLVIPAGGLGTFTGGFIAKRFKLNRSQMLKMYILSQMVTIPLGLGFLFYCPQVDFNGVTISQNSEKDFYTYEDLNLECNPDCFCDPSEYKPVCGLDNVMHFSSCFAGCKSKQLTGNNETEYLDCSCVSGDRKVALAQTCSTECNNFYGFAVLMFVSIWFTFMSAMPNVVATLRAVETNHRSLALGLQSIILRLVGTIPGPVFFGVIIDRTCLLMGENCLFYDNYRMSLFMMLIVVITKVVGVMLFVVALFFSLRLNISEEEEEEEDCTTNNNLTYNEEK